MIDKKVSGKVKWVPETTYGVDPSVTPNPIPGRDKPMKPIKTRKSLKFNFRFPCPKCHTMIVGEIEKETDPYESRLVAALDETELVFSGGQQ